MIEGSSNKQRRMIEESESSNKHRVLTKASVGLQSERVIKLTGVVDRLLNRLPSLLPMPMPMPLAPLLIRIAFMYAIPFNEPCCE
jgi:hypothetical protein